MEKGDNRQIPRDSLFLMADLRAQGVDGVHRIKVRNLSPGGMMGEGSVRVVRGTVVEVDLRNIGWVTGTVAWVQESRFGVAFRDDIDPSLAREPASRDEDRASAYADGHETQLTSTSVLRKI